MKKLRNWNDVKQHQVNKEAEYSIPDRPMPKINNRRFLAFLKSQRKVRAPGIYNFVKTNIINPLLP